MKLKMKKSEKLEDHFKEALSAVVAALRAGYSVENAFVEAYKDLAYRFGKKRCYGLGAAIDQQTS